MPIYEVLKTATINPAQALGLDHAIGSIAPNKLADLIFYNLADNPLQTLNILRHFVRICIALLEDTAAVQWVMKNGVIYNAATMDVLYPSQSPRAPLPQLNPYGPPGTPARKRRSHHP